MKSSMANMGWSLLTPAGVPGAVAIVQVDGDASAVCESLRMAMIGVGRVGVRDVLGVDRALVACVTPTCIQIMPHGGTAVVRELLRALDRAGICELKTHRATSWYSEAANSVEARVLAALAHAASPRAVDVLLDQPCRWLSRPQELVSEAHAISLSHLITPPIVAAVGPANIGKSTLLNTLAGRQVAIAADEPGTTRDHVGVLLDVDGVTIRYVDTPGMRATNDSIEHEAQIIAMDVARHASMVLLVADATSSFVQWTSRPGQIVLRVGLRADLGPIAGADVSTSARTGHGVPTLASVIRERLVPDAALADPRPWRFWQD